MDEHKEEGEFVEHVKEAGGELDAPVKTEALGAEVDVPAEDHNGDSKTVAHGSDSGACNSRDVGSDSGGKTNGGESLESKEVGEVGPGLCVGSLEVEDVDKNEKAEKEDEEREAKATDGMDKLQTEKENTENDDDSEGAEKPLNAAAVEEIERNNDEIHAIEGIESAVAVVVTDEKAECDVECQKGDASEEPSETTMIMERKEKQSSKKTEADDEKTMDDDSENTIEEVKDQKDGLPVEEEEEEEVSNVNQQEGKGEAMEIDRMEEEEQVEGVNDTQSGGVENAEEARDVSMAEADEDDSNIEKGQEIEEKCVGEQKDNVDKIVSKDSTEADTRIEVASKGEVEQMDHNVLFDPKSDIANYIDFGGVSPSSGNVQEIKTKNVIEEEENREVTDTKDESNDKGTSVIFEPRDLNKGDEMEIDREEVAAADPSKEAYDAEKPEEIREEEEEDVITKQESDGQGAANIGPNKEQSSGMGLKVKDSSEHIEGTNGVKRKADALANDLSEERKTISLAKVSISPSHAQRPSFKIGACIARAATQITSSPPNLKVNTFGDDNLSVENFLSQFQSAATDPANENAVSEIAAGFFLDFRNSVASKQVITDTNKVSGKRGRPPHSSVGGTEAFEFEEMSDTYWTDRVIHNGGEEQTQTQTQTLLNEKGSYQVVPVELKPAQMQRTRRPYTKRKHVENVSNNNSRSEGFDKNAPAELMMSFSETDTIPSEMSLNKMFKHFGPLRESQTEVDQDTSRARVVFKKGADAEVAYSSAGRFNIFGARTVNYELSYIITEPFKIQPYVVTFGEEDASMCIPSQS